MKNETKKEGLFFERLVSVGQDYKLSDSAFGAHHKIIEYVGKDKKVLDVGCGAGYLGEIFKKNGCYVAGIESDPNRAKEAEKILDASINNDIESPGNLPFPENFFDVIVMADVLEHLKRPDTALVKLKKYLNKGGCVIVSVPNISRIDVRLKFLFGNFDYEEGGILDKTHLRFFTKKTASMLLEESGYEITKIGYTGFFSKIKMLKPLFNMLAFQFIFLAVPRQNKDRGK